MAEGVATTTGAANSAGSAAGARTAIGAVLIGALLAVCATVGPVALGVAVVVVQGCLLSGWHQLLRAPGAFGGSLVALGVGVAAVAGLEIHWTKESDVGRLAPVLALGVVACFCHQIARQDGRGRLLDSLTATAALVVAVALTALWIVVLRGQDGRNAVLVGVVAAVVAAAAQAVVPRGGWVVAILAGAGAGLVTGAASGLDLAPIGVLLLAAGAAGPAVVAAHLRRATGRLATTAPATLAALPCALAALPLWVLARVLIG